MIEDHLPRYYEAHTRDIRYDIERSIMIDGHEVAWMKYKGDNIYGAPFEGHELKCECYFTEGIGWEERDGRPIGIWQDEQDCVPLQTAKHLRHLELRKEYKERFKELQFPNDYLSNNIPAIILDLIEKSKAGQCLGESDGASFWGGCFYIQTVKEIVDCSWETLWKTAREMEDAKQISMEGSVVQEYMEAKPDGEDGLGNYMRIGEDVHEGEYVIRAWQPANSDAPQTLIVKVFNGLEVVAERTIPMMHQNTFGIDAEDMAALEAATEELIQSLV